VQRAVPDVPAAGLNRPGAVPALWVGDAREPFPLALRLLNDQSDAVIVTDADIRTWLRGLGIPEDRITQFVQEKTKPEEPARVEEEAR